MDEVVIKENQKIEDMIYEVRGVQVMLSTAVAKLYKTETRIINQTIKRNIMRFPGTFCFKLTKIELEDIFLRSQIATLKINNDSICYNLKSVAPVWNCK